MQYLYYYMCFATALLTVLAARRLYLWLTTPIWCAERRTCLKFANEPSDDWDHWAAPNGEYDGVHHGRFIRYWARQLRSEMGYPMKVTPATQRCAEIKLTAMWRERLPNLRDIHRIQKLPWVVALSFVASADELGAARVRALAEDLNGPALHPCVRSSVLSQILEKLWGGRQVACPPGF
jgi:hypothetical protein